MQREARARGNTGSIARASNDAMREKHPVPQGVAAKCGVCVVALLSHTVKYGLRRASRIHLHFASNAHACGLIQRFPGLPMKR